ncbi:MAG TPA: anthranilate phosphoribosyltransferase [Armatimonadota bacterium]|nr:anthranilate phosphoribosyltransferase [Armatimonadota bacterium]
MLSETIARLVDGQTIDRDEAYRAMTAIMTGEATDAQIGAFLVALRMRGETAEQISGFARAMRESSLRVHSAHPDVVDTCGTGGDSLDTFNISTGAALVTAAAGVPVAKHGNRSVSSRCGSADVLSELGVRIDLEPAEVEKCLDEVGIGFLFAPTHHPAMKYAIGPRRELGLRTVFNILGPLTNPAGATRQVVGVFAPELTQLMAETLADLQSARAMVVHGLDGLDELSTLGPTQVSELRDGEVITYTVEPEDVGLRRAAAAEIAGGEPDCSAQMLIAALAGDDAARTDIVVLNAAAAIYIGGAAEDLTAGVAKARAAVEDGAAIAKLDELRETTQRLAAAREG